MNKKLITALVAVAAVLALSFCLAACGDGTTGSMESGAAQKYPITIKAEEDVIAYADAKEASADTKISVTVKVPIWKTVVGVSGSGISCEKNISASTISEEVFTFVMPSKTVELVVETTYSDIGIEVYDGLSWVSAPSRLFASDLLNDSVRFEVGFGENFIAVVDDDGNLKDVKIISTNQNVIPNDAVVGLETEEGDKGISGASFVIDATKISRGKTTLIFEDPYNERAIAKQIEVVDNRATVTYIYPDGSNVSQTYNGYENSPFIAQSPETPDITDRLFVGWYEDKEFTQKVIFPYSLDGIESTTLYAKYDLVYKVMLLGGSTQTSISVPRSDPILTEAPTSEPPIGKYLAGWYLDEELTQQVKFPYTVTGDVTFYAQWEDMPGYLVTFNTMGGDPMEARTIAVIPGSGNMPDEEFIPTREGYVFQGWYQNEADALAGRRKMSFPFTIRGDRTIYAGWTEELDPNEVQQFDRSLSHS